MPICSGIESKDFFVWVDPRDWQVQHNMGLVGSFVGGTSGLNGGSPEYLQFIANPNPKPTPISPFHNNLTYLYRVEYNLELTRYHHPEFRSYPSRFWALFLLNSIEDALAYQKAHPSHVEGRVLKRCCSVGQYTYSMHDAAWIDFLRLKHSVDQQTWEDVAEAYWRGRRTDQPGFKFNSLGETWSPKSVTEVLYYGRVDFPNKNPAVPDWPPPLSA